MKSRKGVVGKGVNDASYATQVYEKVAQADGTTKFVCTWRCPYYLVWVSMLTRCYSPKYHKEKKSYLGCSVCPEWIYFSNFREWMCTQEWEGKQLDKDILCPGNKVYSPETCVFVDKMTNSFLTDRKGSRGEWPLGVHWNDGLKKFIADCSQLGKGRKHLGCFTTPEEAHQKWVSEKIRLAKILASRQTDPRVAEALVSRYEKMRIENEQVD